MTNQNKDREEFETYIKDDYMSGEDVDKLWNWHISQLQSVFEEIETELFNWILEYKGDDFQGEYQLFFHSLRQKLLI